MWSLRFLFLTSDFTQENINARSMFQRSTGGKALCETRGETLDEMCCQGVELKCFGCNNKLLNKFGIPCEEQPTSIESPSDELKRDCFCDSSCLLFDDCCKDFKRLCGKIPREFKILRYIFSYKSEQYKSNPLFAPQ